MAAQECALIALVRTDARTRRRTEKLEERIRVTPNDAASHAALGDRYLFEMNWIAKAIASHEKAEVLTPDELEYRWRLMDLYLNASRADKSLAELKFLSEHLPEDKHTREWYEIL